MTSCSQENLEPSTNINGELDDDWVSFFESKTSDWTTTFSTEKTNVCGWADNPGNTIDCSGGSCFIRTDVPGHAACIGCTVSDDLACFGSNGETLLIILNEMAVSFPTVGIEYEVLDKDGDSLGKTEGQLGSEISTMISLSALAGVTTYTANISSN
jgi:hypothetical protein